MKYSRIPVIATLSLLAACGSDSKSPTDINNGNVSGTASFTYTGGGGGSYSATGAIASSAIQTTPFATTWATGWKDNSDNSTNIAANIPRTGGLADFLVITINSQTTGAATIDPNCSPTNTTSCNEVVFVIGMNASGETFSYGCLLESGTITILSISSTNATGSFAGSGTCFDASQATSAFTVTNGSFNVPLLTNIPGNI